MSAMSGVLYFPREKQSSACRLLQHEKVSSYKWKILTQVIPGISDTVGDCLLFPSSVIPPPEMGSSPRVTSGTSSFWPNNKSRMYVLENTAAFVMSHGLVEGDLLVIYRVLQGGYVLRGMKKKNASPDIEPVKVEFAYSSPKGSLERQPSLHENGTLVQRLYGGCPSDKSVKEEPVNLDDVILSMIPSFESDSSCIQTLERFPSLTLDFPFEEMMAVTRTEPDGW